MDNQNNYEPNMNSSQPPVDYEKKARTIFTLGIVGICVGLLCCGIAGPVLGIIGLVMANGMASQVPYLSEDGQKKHKTGKILCIISIAVCGVLMIINMINSANTYNQLMEMMSEYM